MAQRDKGQLIAALSSNPTVHGQGGFSGVGGFPFLYSFSHDRCNQRYLPAPKPQQHSGTCNQILPIKIDMLIIES